MKRLSLTALAILSICLCGCNQQAKQIARNDADFLAAGHALAIPMYERFCELLSQNASRPVQKGVFGADMQCALINDGPVTIIIDSRIKE